MRLKMGRCALGGHWRGMCLRKSKLQMITIGPVSQGDADKIYTTAKELGLPEQGLYKSEWVE